MRKLTLTAVELSLFRNGATCLKSKTGWKSANDWPMSARNLIWALAKLKFNRLVNYESAKPRKTSGMGGLTWPCSANCHLLTVQCRCRLAMWILSVGPFLCLFVKRVSCDKTEERSVQIFIPYERVFSLVLGEEERLVGATHSTWNFGSTGPRWSEIVDFEPIFARSASAVTPSEKNSININRTRNSSGDEIANVNFRNDDIIQALQNTIDSCINSATDRYLQRRFNKFSEITQCNGKYAVQCHLRSPILVPIESSYTTSY